MKTSELILCTLLLCGNSVNASGQAAAPKQGIAQANGIEIAYETFGAETGETILMIQGTGTQLTAWPVSLCEQLASEGYRVVRFDHRDIGLSTKLDSLGMPDWPRVFKGIGSCDDTPLPYSLTDMAKDAIGLLDALGVRKAHIVGASMGGAIAQLVAIRFPERTLSLTSIMASSGNPARTQGNARVLQALGTPPPETNDRDSIAYHLASKYQLIGSPGYPTPFPALLSLAKADLDRSWSPMGNMRHAAAVIVGDNCDRRDALRRIAIPAVVVHGEDDPVVNIEAGREVAAAIPDATFVPIAGMGHDLPPDLVSKLSDCILLAVRAAD